MSDAAQRKLHRASPELVAIVSLGLTILLAVLGQAAWLDGKIERLDARLSGKIETLDTRLTGKIETLDIRLTERIDSVDAKHGTNFESLRAGQIEIRERLAALEAWAGLAGSVDAGGASRVDSSP